MWVEVLHGGNSQPLILSPTTGEGSMPQEECGYRVHSSAPASGPLWPAGTQQLVVRDRDAAIAIAAKTHIRTEGVIEVVHLTSGAVVYKKRVSSPCWPDSLSP